MEILLSEADYIYLFQMVKGKVGLLLMLYIWEFEIWVHSFLTLNIVLYEGNSISKLQIQVAIYAFELSVGNCHR